MKEPLAWQDESISAVLCFVAKQAQNSYPSLKRFRLKKNFFNLQKQIHTQKSEKYHVVAKCFFYLYFAFLKNEKL